MESINKDSYAEGGVVTVLMNLSNKSKNVQFFVGGVVDGAFDQDKAKDITVSTGMGYIELFRTESGGRDYIDVVAVYITRFKNREIIIKRIKLPYKDLK